MNQRLFLGAYWNARQESVEDCAARLNQFLSGLKEIHPQFSRWYERGRSRSDALTRPVESAKPSELERLLLKGRNRYDEGGGIIEELGFSIGLWNGAPSDDEEASLRIGCGCFDAAGNNIVLNLPMQCALLSSDARASALLALVAKSWHPDWAGIMSNRAVSQRNFDAGHPFVDWMVYVPRSVETMPPPARVETVEGLGSIIVVQPDPPTGERPEELSRILRVERILAL